VYIFDNIRNKQIYYQRTILKEKVLKKMPKIRYSITYLTIIFVLAVSTLASMTFLPQKVAQAATFPSYRYSETFTSSTGSAQGNAVATDSSGDIFQAGQFTGTVNFAGTQGTDNQTSSNTGAFVTKYSNNGTYDWTDTIPANSYAYGESVAVDSQGNVYVAGQFSGTVNFAGTQGTDNQNDAGGNGDAFLTKYDSNGTYAWTQTFDTTSGYAQGFGVSVDKSGNVDLTGAFSGTINFEGTQGTDSQSSPNSNGDGFVTQFNTSGTYAWTRIFNGSGLTYVSPYGIAADSNGNVYVDGEFSGTVNFAGSQGTDNQTDAGGSGDGYLAEYSSSGIYIRTETFDTSAAGGTYANPYAVAVDSNGDAYVAGEFTGTVNFKGTQGTDNRTDTGGAGDGFLTKFNSSGSYLYTNTFITTTSSDNALPYGMTTDSAGNVYLAGGFLGTINFAGSQGTDNKTDPTGSGDVFLTQYAPDGTYNWTAIFGDPSGGGGGPGDPYAIGVVTDPLGNAYITGAWTGTITFDGPGGSDTRTSGVNDAFLTSYITFVPPSESSGGSNGGSTSGSTPPASAPKSPDTGMALVSARFGMPLLGISLFAAGIYLVSRQIKTTSRP
jgi:hypothetical protein